MKSVVRMIVCLVFVAMLGQEITLAALAGGGGYNLLPNAAFMKVRSGYWPDWWNWYNALGNNAIDLDKSWQLVDEHHIPGTRSVKLSDHAQCQTSFLRIMFQTDVPLTFSVYLKSDKPDTKANMYIYQDGWNAINKSSEVTVGTQWKRYQVTAKPEKKSRSQHNFVNVTLSGPGTLWVNAPQLEEGKTPTEWKLSLRDKAKQSNLVEKQAAPKFPMPRIDCMTIDTPIVIDGVLDDAAWKQATKVGQFMRLDEDQPAQNPTDAYICRDDDNFYVAFRCHESEMDKLKAKQNLRDAVGLFKEDSVEVFLSSNEDGSDYLRFATNALGTQVDSKGFTMFFDAQWQCAAYKGEDFWSVEFRLPFSSLVRPLQPGTPWRLNLTRYRARPKVEEYSAWAPVIRTFHDYEHHGFLNGMVSRVSSAADRHASSAKVTALFDRSFYTTEAKANLFVDAAPGTAVQLKLNGSQRKHTLTQSRLVPIDLSGVAFGRHAVELSVSGIRKQITLVKLQPKVAAVKIDQINRVFLVDDKPFIPIGPNGDKADKLKNLADHGYNCPYAQMHEDFTPEAKKRIEQVLDKAQSLKMKVIIWYFNYRLVPDHAGYQAELLKMVETFKDHPALLGWWVFDEPTSNIQWLKGLCDAVREVDPYHPVFGNWADRGHGWTTEMGDVSGNANLLDGYYINAFDYSPNEAHAKIGGHCAQMTADAKPRGNVVGYLNGLYGWASAIREPSPQENRFVTYVSLIQGARMLLYYNWGPPANPALRASLIPLSREIQTLAPITAYPEVKQKITCDNKKIDYTAFDTPQGLYVIAINTDEKDEVATFHIEYAQGDVSVLFENRKQRIINGQLKDNFAPLMRHVYRVKIKNPS